jgi:multidrug efflux pump
MPIMYVNISGDYDGMKLKYYADKLQDAFEDLTEITRADIVGAPEREIQINVDPFKMQAAKISFNDIEMLSILKIEILVAGQIRSR